MTNLGRHASADWSTDEAGSTARILLLIDGETNRRMLSAALAQAYDVVIGSDDAVIDEAYDLGVADGPALVRLRKTIAARKQVEEPALLPFLLISSRSDIHPASSGLWHVVDDVATTPMGKAELQARVALLLKLRRLSLELKRRNDDLQMFVHALSHDLRAPARFARGFSEALREDCAAALDQQGRHYLARIEDATQRITDFLDLLLDYARLGQQRVTPRPVPLESAVRSAISHVAESIAEAGAEVQVQGPFPTVWGDPGLIDVVLTNFLTNAIKFVKPSTRASVRLSARTDGGAAWVDVADRGVGIPAEDLDRIFEPLVRLYGEERYEGSGLGLAIVQRAAKLMGGRVSVSSVLGEGSTFSLELPLKEGEGP